MIDRILEPEVMDSEEEAIEYDQMDFTEVNTDFAQLASQLTVKNASVLDLGTGTARIPIILSNLCPQCQITAIDLAPSMLKIAHKNVDLVHKKEQIKLELADSKNLNYQDNSFDLVISNSLVHHIPDPLELFREIDRVMKPHGQILIRDLLRPQSEAAKKAIVNQANLDYSSRQEQLFADSLHASLTIPEVQDIMNQVGWRKAKIYQSSPRHWTLELRQNQ